MSGGWDQSARTNQPGGAPLGFYEPKIQDLVLAKVIAAGGSATSTGAIIRIKNPSRRIGVGFQVHFEPATRTDVNTWGASSWSHWVYDPAGDHRLHELEAGEDLPRMYEAETYAPGFLISATLALPLNAAAAVIPGNWVARVRFEPCMPFCEAEINRLYSDCFASLVTPVVTISP